MNSQEYLKLKFGEYYKNNELDPPDRFTHREFGFLLFGKKQVMKRHLAFNNVRSFREFIQNNVPAHIYYSSAFYRMPSAPTTAEKGWLGAELIFDFDADHLENAQNMSYEEQLDRAKQECIKLIDDFLVGDFGFDPKNISIYFSGGRGYHCHVMDPRVFSLASKERREIIDYLLANGLDKKGIFSTTWVPVGKKKGYYIVNIPDKNSPGWRGRISRAVFEMIEQIKSKSEDEAVDYIINFGVDEEKARKVFQVLTPERLKRIEQGYLDQSKELRDFFLNQAVLKSRISAGICRADEPVTTDTKRLIRLPGSLHGKTGLKVLKADLENFKEFNPLKDAIAFSGESVRIDVLKPFRIKLGGENFNLSLGEMEIPEYLAIFAIARDLAKISNE
jgi:DNA primase small subunit